MTLPSWSRILPYILLFLVTPGPSYQVNIRLNLWAPNDRTSTSLPPADFRSRYETICNDIEPGRCCRALPNYTPLVAAISGMLPLDIGTVWEKRGDRGGCAGAAVESRAGPGTFYYPDRSRRNANWAYPGAREATSEPSYEWIALSGASYMRLPGGKPDYSADAKWLETEGILALAWGGGKWVSDRMSSNLASSLMGMSLGSILPRIKRSDIGKREIMSAFTGKVLTQPPGIAVWPDEVIINGPSYKETGLGSLKYVSATGETVNLSAGG